VRSPWLVFIKERFPLFTYALLAVGFTVSAGYLSDQTFSPITAISSIFGQLLFFLTLRVMDEYKDYDKDILAHPDRPLPRGLITPLQARRAIYFLLSSMILFIAVVMLVWGWAAGCLYLITATYLYLMFKEFFIGASLARYPLLYALSHQIVLFPLVLFSVALFGSLHEHTLDKCLYAAMVFFAFFSYEICRKLDPNAPVILGTYWKVSGKLNTTLAIVLLATATIVSAFDLFHSWYLGATSFLVLFTFGIFLIRPASFKWVEAAASLSLLLHIWSIGIWRLLV